MSQQFQTLIVMESSPKQNVEEYCCVHCVVGSACLPACYTILYVKNCRLCSGYYFICFIENPKDEEVCESENIVFTKRNDLLFEFTTERYMRYHHHYHLHHRSIVVTLQHISPHLMRSMPNGMAKNRRKKEIQQSHHRI